jgi:hypothetical protein
MGRFGAESKGVISEDHTYDSGTFSCKASNFRKKGCEKDKRGNVKECWKSQKNTAKWSEVRGKLW